MLSAMLLAACAVSPPPASHAEARAALERQIAVEVSAAQLPGASFALLREGRLLHQAAFGVADRSRGTPMQPQARMRIASVSKPLTAIAVLRLVDMGRLQLDQPVLPLLSSRLPGGFVADPAFSALSVRQLLSHCGGWDRARDFDPVLQSRHMAGVLGLSRPPTAVELVAWALSRPPDFLPGARCAYSNIGYAVLGRLIEAETGASYEQAVTDLVLQAAGLDQMRLAATLPHARQPDEPVYHDPRRVPSAFDPAIEVAFPDGGFVIESMDASGGWLASAADLVRLVSALEGHAGAPLLSDATRREMLTPMWREPGSRGSVSRIRQGGHYGLGWDIPRRGHGYWHAGDLPGSAALLVREADGSVWALLANGSMADARMQDRLRRRIGHAVRELADSSGLPP
jgi:CubicO group peptidase (beta-lactamase class C family)